MCRAAVTSVTRGGWLARPPSVVVTLSVWYVFIETPQHMPDELLFTIPPIMHESIDAGSGPILYLRRSAVAPGGGGGVGDGVPVRDTMTMDACLATRLRA